MNAKIICKGTALYERYDHEGFSRIEDDSVTSEVS